MSDRNQPNPRRFSYWRALRWLCLLLCVGYVAFCIYFYYDQESWLIHANDDPTDYVAKPSLEFSKDEFLSPPKEPEVTINYQKFDALVQPVKGVVFYLHGNKGNLYKCRWEIEPFLTAGYDVWTMDYRTFGNSTGHSSETALLNDANLVYQQVLAHEGIEAKDTIIWGRSFGSGVAASVAAKNPPKALVLETPYWSLADAARQANPLLPSFVFRYELPTYQFVEKLPCDVHLIHGTQDEMIPFHSSERLKVLRESQNRKVVPHPIMGGQHNLRKDGEFRSVIQKILS